MQPSQRCARWSLFLTITIVGVLGAWAAATRAQQPAPTKATAAKDTTPQKRIAFEMRDKAWKQVFEWLTDQTGLPLVSTYIPTGSFNFISPRGEDKQPRKYTIPEIIDIINEGLLVGPETQQYVLIRRQQSFTLVPASEDIPAAILERIPLEDLDKHGKSEIVSLVLPLKTLVAADLAPEISKIKGPFGKVVALDSPNQLYLQDTVARLRDIIKTVKDIEKGEQAETFTHQCKYIKARDAEQTLKVMLGDAREEWQLKNPRPVIERGGGFPQPAGPGGTPSRSSTVTAAPKLRMHYVTSDERTNTVLVSGPANKIAMAKAVLDKLDVPQPGSGPVLIGVAFIKTYPVPNGNADQVAKTLQDMHKATSSLRISAVGSNSIMVYGTPEDQFKIAMDIQGTRVNTATTEVIALTQLDAGDVGKTLQGMFGDYKDAKASAPYIEADTTTNSIKLRGTEDQVKDVKAAIRALGEGGGGASGVGGTRTITLEKGSAAALADALQQLLPQMRKNPVKVIDINGGGSEPAPKAKPKPKLPVESSLDRDDEGTQFVQLADPQKKIEKKTPDNLPGKADMPIRIMAFGNRLVISSDDPQALALVQQLVRLMTQTAGNEGDFQIIRLKNANAVQAAQVLDEAFNGPKEKTTQQQGGGRGFGGGGLSALFGRGAQAPSNPRPERIRVVADTGTNSLLVKATPIDMLTIRSLLNKAIDTGETNSKAVMRTWVIGPLKNASALEVSHIIRDVYRESINNNPSVTTVLGSPGFAFTQRSRGGVSQNVDANGNPQGVSLSIGVDDQTNTLVLQCSETMKDDIEKLVMQLEKAAKDSTRTVKVISIKGVDPLLVQQAIDAIQGRRPATTSTARPGTTGYPSTGPSGFTPGGFTPSGYTPSGFTPGGGGPRGGGPGGGGPGGGGGGRGGPRGGGSSQESRGPDFFAQRVMDDPESSTLFDPQHDVAPTSEDHGLSGVDESAGQATPRPNTSEHGTFQAISFEEEQQQPPPPAAPAAPESGNFKGSRSPVTVEALKDLGVIVISGNNPADVAEVIRIIEFITKLGAGGDVQIQIVPLREADATSVTNSLNQLYQRLVVTPSGISTVPGRPGGQGPTTTPGQPAGGVTAAPVATGQQQQGAYSVVLLPLPRLNSILVAAPKAQINEVIQKIANLDRPGSPLSKATAFPLKQAAARQVATQLNTFFASRYAQEGLQQDQIRFTYDDNTNTVFVQAAPADLAEIRDLITWMDTNASRALNELRFVPLKNALSDDLTTILSRALTEGTVLPSTTGAPTAAGAIPGPAAALAAPGVPRPTTPGATVATKTVGLRFFSTRKESPNVFESGGVLADIFIISDPRTNSLLISAPEKTMKLILAVIQEMDVVPQTTARINIFFLKKADATAVASMLQQLFVGTTTAGAGAKVGGGPGAPAGGFPGAPTTAGAALGQPLALGTNPEGAAIVPLRASVDLRTNSILVAGTQSDLDVVHSIITRLDDAVVAERKNEVYQLRNSVAADVANALTTFLPQTLTVISTSGTLTTTEELQRAVIIVPEPITNTLLISANERYFDETLQLISKLDAQPPQVAIQVLIADIEFNGTEEFGVELGGQSPVLFQRSIIPTPSLLGAGTVSYATTYLPAGVTVTGSSNPTTTLGFPFNDPAAPLGNNPMVNPGVVGYQGLTSLGVGRVSPITPGVSGLVFSAGSDSLNILVRALRTQGRLDILTRPQITTTDNQTATILDGQYFPYVTGSTITTGITGIPAVTNTVGYRNIGVQLVVTPKINPDNTVILRCTPEISTTSATNVNLGNGVNAVAFNVQTVDTTVIAHDGETVAIGGLIVTKDMKSENKVPWLGDLPCVGSLFRYRAQVKSRNELLVIMTPHILRCAADRERLLAMEAKRMSWKVGDVLKIQGTSGMEPILPGPKDVDLLHGPMGPLVNPALVPTAPPPVVPDLSMPRPVAPGQSQAPAGPPLTPLAVNGPAPSGPALAGTLSK